MTAIPNFADVPLVGRISNPSGRFEKPSYQAATRDAWEKAAGQPADRLTWQTPETVISLSLHLCIFAPPRC